MEETFLNKTFHFFVKKNEQLSWIGDLKKFFFFLQKANIHNLQIVDACNNYKVQKKKT